MQFTNFPEFLRERYKACIRVSFEEGILNKYPTLVSNFVETWKKIENLGTCPYQFRLVFLEPDPTPQQILNKVDDFAHVEADPSHPSNPPDLLWFKYWMNLFFEREQMPQYNFIDIPICCIHFSTFPVIVQQTFPDWAKEYSKDVRTFNIVINPETTQKSGDTYLCKDASCESFYDVILNITHYRAAHTLSELKDRTAQFVNDNWHGFGNSVRRLFGFGGRVSRATVVLELKRLGDICLSCKDYQNAFSYYQQLYNEYTNDDPKVEDSLLITMAVTSILSTDELDVVELLKPTLAEKGQGYHFYQSMFLMSFYAATHKNMTYARKVLIHVIKRISRSHHPYSIVAFPILAEAASFCSLPKKGAMYLHKASNGYKQLKLEYNERMCLWRLYRKIKGQGWPHLEQTVLLRIAETGDLPIELHQHLEQRSLILIEPTISTLKEMELVEPVRIGSILCHDVFVKATGFPMSPPPSGVTLKEWEQLRKRLFPVAYHPSTDRFTASAWSNDTLDITNIAVGEEGTVHFRLSPTPRGKCIITNVKLMIDDETTARSDVIEKLELTQQREVELKFLPLKESHIIIRGVKFDWNDAAPGVVLFGEMLKFESIENPPVVELSIEGERNDTFPDHPIEFKLRTHHVSGPLVSLHVVINSLIDVSMVNPKQNSAQMRWALDHQADDNEVTFSVLPTTRDFGKNRIQIFISYTSTDTRVTRFAYCPFDFICKEFPKISEVLGNSTILLNSEATIKEVTCNNAEIKQDGNMIDILASNENRAQNTLLTVSRVVSGIETTGDVKIPDLYLTIKAPSSVKPEKYPAFIDVEIEAVYLHPEKEKKVTLRNAQGTDWIWSGKTVFYIRKPKETFNVKILALRPFTSDIGLHIDVDNGRKFHKILSLI